MRETYYFPGFRRPGMTRVELITRPRVHLCGLVAGECRDEFEIPPRIQLMTSRWHFLLHLPHRPQRSAWVDEDGNEMGEPAQWWPRLVVERDKRYVWPRHRHWEQKGYIEGVERGKSIRDRELRREETP